MPTRTTMPFDATPRYGGPRTRGYLSAVAATAAFVALVTISCSDSGQPLAPEARFTLDAAHTWTSGNGGGWHGYHAPTVNYNAAASPFELCAIWADESLFARDDARYADTGFFSFDFFQYADGDWVKVGSANSRDRDEAACYIVGQLAEGTYTFRAAGMARHGKGKSTTTHHTLAWEATVTTGDIAEINFLVTVAPAAPEIELDGSVQLVATVKDAADVEVADPALTWESDDTDVATVDADGLVTATGSGHGSVKITATYSSGGTDYSGNATVLVLEASAPELVPGTFSAGNYHTCALTAAGAAYCWGRNQEGQIGDNTIVHRTSPTAVEGGLAFARIAAGFTHTCALTADGAAYCWGLNSSGRLGDGTTINRRTPVAVSGGHVFAEIVASDDHTCAATAAGATYCWGGNLQGQLGNNSNTARSVPTAVFGTQSFSGLSAGTRATCALDPDGRAFCWGYGINGKLGDGTALDRWRPTAVLTEHRFTQVSAGASHGCAVKANGQAYCWGSNNNGQFGAGYRNAPGEDYTLVAVEGDHDFVNIVAAGRSTCGLTRDNVPYCWGGNTSGIVGDGTTTDRYLPTLVSGSHRFMELSATNDHACAIPGDGRILCWGNNVYGGLGDGTFIQRRTPTAVLGWPVQ
jgi:alpha-tubulin suppressor-like RCC1 family protein